MKKLLTILGAVGLTASTGATVIACGNPDEKPVSKMSLEELQKKFDDWEKEADKLLEEAGDNPEGHPEIMEKMMILSYRVYDFIIKIYLDTNYQVEFKGGASGTETIVSEIKDQSFYKKTLSSLIYYLKGTIEHDKDEKHQSWIKIFETSIPKLEEKLKNLADD